ncbi:MAG: TRAFs-binding domain-containing protein [Paracoccaceae bacterium]
MTAKPLCFILMPFGQKPDGRGGVIDFDAVYAELIKPATVAADLEPIRADEEQTGGVIHKPMFERLILCEYAVADLTTANANVFYELGVRHAVKPRTTQLVFAKGGAQLPFDVALLRALPYHLDRGGKPTAVDADREALTQKLREARSGAVDSPVYQLVDDFPEIDHTKTDVFRDQVAYSERIKEALAQARRNKTVQAVMAVEAGVGSLEDEPAGVLVDLFLSYRAVSAWDEMIRLAAVLPKHLAGTVMIQEQFGLALNRADKGEEAEKVLLRLIERRGPSSETYGILGRVYKDRWDKASKAGQKALARGLLSKAIDTYRKGFETDWRDAYPGVNAVTLMELKEPPDPAQRDLLPVVRYAVQGKIKMGRPDYWDHATLLELAVLSRDEDAARAALADALACLPEGRQAETTARNLLLIREARAGRGDDTTWIEELEQALEEARTS